MKNVLENIEFNKNQKVKKSNVITKKSAAIFMAALCLSLSSGTYTENVYAVRSINQIQSEKNQVKSNLDAVNSELVSLMANVDALTTEISSKEEEIKALKENIGYAEKAVDDQYKAIKLRLKYTYENSSTNNILTIILGSKSIGDFINRVEYVNSIYKYDEDLLETYDATEKELENLKKIAEEDKVTLEAKRNELAAGQAQLNAKIASLKAKMGNIDKELKEAQEIARKKAEEERRRAMLEQERRATSARGGRHRGKEYSYMEGGNPEGSVNGGSIVGYANQFVGNPYVWGGNSLTDGVDCSGFVHQVYGKFGHKLPRYSQSFLGVGKPVGIDNIQPGDIVIYPGHVAMYAGGGKIVEAQDPKHGITNNRSVHSGRILGIRRL